MPPAQGFLPNAPLFPPRASEMAREIDLLFFTTLGVTVFFSTLIAVLIFYFMVRYRRTSPTQVGVYQKGGSTGLLESTWIIGPLVIALGFFAWGARIFFAAARPPADAKQYYVIGKRWMWKIEHPSGRREINELHVPRGQAVKLKLTSEDVVHSFFLPVMRMKTDAIPGRYTTLWFNADTLGTFHLFCAEYCGTEHSRMVGRIIVMEPTEYERWIGGENMGGPSGVASGEDLFVAKACHTCHRTDSTARAPQLSGLIGKTVHLEGGQTVTADETYIRESIVNPATKVVAGYQPIMPTYRGQLSEEEIIQLIRYVGSLKQPTGVEPAPAGKAADRPAESPPSPNEGAR
ncbi:MAG TPA: cytochrome c oxidase subunit II [Polyangiaceae bacterium]|nr:cytochrome c oxidase subunit II [Polyangiaceae bacterium]